MVERAGRLGLDMVVVALSACLPVCCDKTIQKIRNGPGPAAGGRASAD